MKMKNKICPYSIPAIAIPDKSYDFSWTNINNKNILSFNFIPVRLCKISEEKKTEKICACPKKYNTCLEYLNKSKKNLSMKLDWDIT